jgi:hypothetical protein
MSISLKQKIGFGYVVLGVLYMLSDILFDLLYEFLDLAVIRHQFTETALDKWHMTSVLSQVKWGSAITIGMSMLMWGLLA